MKIRGSSYKFIRILSIISLSILIAPASIKGLVISFLCCVFVSIFSRTFINNGNEEYLHKENLLYEITIMAMLAESYYMRWKPSGMLRSIAISMHMTKERLLLLVIVVLCITSILAVDCLVNWLRNIMKERDRNYYQDKLRHIGLIISISLIQFLVFQYSSRESLNTIIGKSPIVLVANLALILIINVITVLIFQKWFISLTITSCLFALWGIANYYTIEFHGSPLFFSEFTNIRTVTTVALKYNYQISYQVIIIILLFLTEITIVIQNYQRLKISSSFIKSLLQRATLLMALFITLLLCYKPVIIKDRPWMPWNLSIEKCGFAVCIIKDVEDRLFPISEPKGYSSDKLHNDMEQNNPVDAAYPDIIFILNESFCDLEVYTSFSTDKELFNEFYSIDNSIQGYAVVPNIGGGTNDSEYELLTSKSMYLLNSMAPFTYLNSDCLQRSTVHYLSKFDYKSKAMHCEMAQNYSRDKAYPIMGFDSVILGPENYAYTKKNGNRAWLDSENYRDLIKQYEKMGESPRFIYMLTFQNHGGYDQNDAALDTVHVQNGYDSLIDELNEYLTSVQLSIKAFCELLEYYSEIDRNVIICMVGDHAPSFITNLPEKKEMSFEEAEIVKRSVPYIIWSNYKDSEIKAKEYISMVDLFPRVMQIAGIPLTAFYQYILDLHEEIPVRTSNGVYMDRKGNYGIYSEDDPYFERLSYYYYLEYNSFLSNEEYKEDLFE